jgi:glycerol-1-phosphate dehydrogenase [NAD(P)+]
MPLLARVVNAPLAIDIRPGAVSGLAPLLAEGKISSNGDVAFVVGSGQGAAIAEVLKGVLPSAPVHHVTGGSLESATTLVAELRSGFFDAVIGVGGGGTLDVAKYAAAMCGLPFVSVATNLAHDGIASPVSVLESHGRKGSFGVNTPIAVIVDLDYVRRSPIRHTRAGVGDAVSNISAVADWYLASRECGERVDGLAATLARSSAHAVAYSPFTMDSDEFLTALAESLLLGGIAMAVAGSSRPCSGSCHEISHAIDALFPGATLHGEQVAVGALFSSFLRDDPLAGDIADCFRRHGLPCEPADLGLTVEQFTEAVVMAPTTRPDRYTILEHLALGPEQTRKRVDAFVEAFGR